MLILVALVTTASSPRAESAPGRRIQLSTETANGFDLGQATRDFARACRRHGTIMDLDAEPTVYRPKWLGPAVVTGWCLPPSGDAKINPPIDLWTEVETASWYGPDPAHFEALLRLRAACRELGGHLDGADARYLENTWKILWSTAVITGHCQSGPAR